MDYEWNGVFYILKCTLKGIGYFELEIILKRWVFKVRYRFDIGIVWYYFSF